MSTLEKRLLLAAVRDLEMLLLGKRIPGCTRTHSCYGLNDEIEWAHKSLVHLEPGRWLGQTLSGSDRVAVSRAYARLEKRGLVELVCCNYATSRPNYLEIKPAGRQLAKQLMAFGEASVESVGEQ